MKKEEVVETEVIEAEENNAQPETDAEDVVVPEQPSEEEQMKQFFGDVDETSKAILDAIKEKSLEVVVEALANVVNIVGESTNIEKLKILNGMAEVIQNRYPEQHPLIKVVTIQTGMQAAINFDTDTLFIAREIPKDANMDELPCTMLKIKSEQWVKNDMDIPKEKLDTITIFYRESFPKYKEEFFKQVEANKAKQKEMEELAKEIDKVEDEVAGD